MGLLLIHMFSGQTNETVEVKTGFHAMHWITYPWEQSSVWAGSRFLTKIWEGMIWTYTLVLVTLGWLSSRFKPGTSFVWLAEFSCCFYCAVDVARIFPLCFQVVRRLYHWWDHPQADRGPTQYLYLHQSLGRDGGTAGKWEPECGHCQAIHSGSNLAGAFPGEHHTFPALLQYRCLKNQLLSDCPSPLPLLLMCSFLPSPLSSFLLLFPYILYDQLVSIINGCMGVYTNTHIYAHPYTLPHTNRLGCSRVTNSFLKCVTNRDLSFQGWVDNLNGPSGLIIAVCTKMRK